MEKTSKAARTMSEKLRKAKVSACAIVAGALVLPVHATPAAVKRSGSSYNLRAFYPGPASKQFYLSGYNKAKGIKSDIWYERIPGGGFYLHSTAPGNRCQYDQFKWGSGGLEYSATYEGCGNDTTKWTYDEPIILAPNRWSPSEGSVSKSGISDTNVYKNGSKICTGENHWTMTVKGPETLASGIVALHVQTIETQTYHSIPGVNFKCESKNKKLEIDEENHWFAMGGVSVEGSGGQELAKTSGLVRVLGGKVVGHVLRPDWDVQFSHWSPLPASTSTNSSLAGSRR